MSVSSGGPSRGRSRLGSFMMSWPWLIRLITADGVVGASPGGRPELVAERAHRGPGPVARRADRGAGELLVLLAALAVRVVAGEAIEGPSDRRRGVARALEDMLVDGRERPDRVVRE